MTHAAIAIEIAHRLGVFGAAVMELLYAGNARMWKFGDDVAGNLAAERPARILGRGTGEGVEVGARDI